MPGKNAGNLAGAEPEIIQIAVSIAEKLLNYKVETDFNCILALMAQGFKCSPHRKNIPEELTPWTRKFAVKTSICCRSS